MLRVKIKWIKVPKAKFSKKLQNQEKELKILKTNMKDKKEYCLRPDQEHKLC